MGRRQAGHAFISYVHEDSQAVDQLQRTLEAAGIRVWRDTADLWPGEDWRAKIRHAITNDALVFIACFSPRSLARDKSYQNEELALAIDQLRRRRPDIPWLIPVRFGDCDIPDYDIGAGRTLSSLQRADLFGKNFDAGALRLVAAVLRILGPNSGVTPNMGQVLSVSGDTTESAGSSKPSRLISSSDSSSAPAGTATKSGAGPTEISGPEGLSRPAHKDISTKVSKPRRLDPLRRSFRSFVNLNLWQQVVAGLLVLVIAALAGKLLSGFNEPVKAISKPSTQHGSLTWLSQLTPTTGDFGTSDAVPDAADNTRLTSLPHEISMAAADYPNTVTFMLDRKYKYLKLEAALPWFAPSEDKTIFSVNVDGKAMTLSGGSTTYYFSPGLSMIQNWIINVSNAETLQLEITGAPGASYSPLLVSGSLTD
jgi:hypothetical protein